MTAVNPSWIDTVTLNAFLLRRGDSLMTMTNGANPLGARSGVVPGSGGLAVSVSGTTITVGTGIAAVYFAGQGVYRVAMTSTSTLTQNAAHATLPRIDLVYLRIWDNSVDGAGLNTADVVYLAGTAASSPVAPVPSGSVIYMPLAQLNVPASGGGSTTVNSTVLPITVAPGGILPSSSAPPGPYTGQYYDNGSGGLLRYNGTAWRQVNPYTPITQAQVSQPGSFTAGTFQDFPSANWPTLTFTVPPSGLVWISIGGAVQNTNTTTSSGWVAWRASGGATEAASESLGVSTVGSRTYATRRVLRSWTPGASVTLTPQYLFSSVGTLSTVTRATDGLLAVEPVAAA